MWAVVQPTVEPPKGGSPLKCEVEHGGEQTAAPYGVPKESASRFGETRGSPDTRSASTVAAAAASPCYASSAVTTSATSIRRCKAATETGRRYETGVGFVKP